MHFVEDFDEGSDEDDLSDDEMEDLDMEEVDSEQEKDDENERKSILKQVWFEIKKQVRQVKYKDSDFQPFCSYGPLQINYQFCEFISQFYAETNYPTVDFCQLLLQNTAIISNVALTVIANIYFKTKIKQFPRTCSEKIFERCKAFF